MLRSEPVTGQWDAASMTDVYWLQQTAADVPAENNWLSPNEAVQLNGMRFAKRRADWRLGRWTAKRALAVYLNRPNRTPDLADIEILPAPSGAPEACIANQPAAVTISLSHCSNVAVCAVTRPDIELGCDLEVIEPRSRVFIEDYFTAEEQTLVARASTADRPRLLTLLWSGKESVLKALRTGLRLDTRCVIVSPLDATLREDREGCIENPAFTFRTLYGLNSWCPLQVRYTNGQIFHGWWQYTGSLLQTLVAAPPPGPPILLKTTT